MIKAGKEKKIGDDAPPVLIIRDEPVHHVSNKDAFVAGGQKLILVGMEKIAPLDRPLASIKDRLVAPSCILPKCVPVARQCVAFLNIEGGGPGDQLSKMKIHMHTSQIEQADQSTDQPVCG